MADSIVDVDRDMGRRQRGGSASVVLHRILDPYTQECIDKVITEARNKLQKRALTPDEALLLWQQIDATMSLKKTLERWVKQGGQAASRLEGAA